ncbi:hypothetical protein T4A_4574 [Trichinella pseudospiralis]|uniref:Uncharacterized protein n=1 Tax=Trichinella pseudospiralis TaxID=6337 RepID=A0A0V1DNV0_TRIPS|nr:hypothetical protein T4A_4574 [Trichinella pseudospiralis]
MQRLADNMAKAVNFNFSECSSITQCNSHAGEQGAGLI